MAAKEYVLESVGALDDGQLAFLMRKPDGTLHQHTVPPWTFTRRAGEYGIDPQDWDTLLDVVLHEELADTDGPGLHDADTVEDARGALLARVERCRKNRVTVTVPGKKDLTEALAAALPVDIVDVARAEMDTDLTRRAVRQRREQGRGKVTPGRFEWVPPGKRP